MPRRAFFFPPSLSLFFLPTENVGASCPLSPPHTPQLLFLHPPLAAAIKLQPGPMMNVAAQECKRRHLKSERPS